MGKAYFWIIIALHTISSSLAEQRYDMNDLRALAKENNHKEFFNHALDIRPSARNQEWKDTVEEQGLDFLSKLMSKIKFEPQDYKLVHHISKWPVFISNEFFIKKRDFAFIKEIKNCFKNLKLKDCKNKVEIIFNDYEHDVLFSFDLTKALSTLGYTQEELWKYAKPLAHDPLSEFYCNKQPFAKIVLERIYTIKPGQNYQDLNIHPDCLKVMRNTVLSTVDYQSLSERKYAFDYLKKHINIQEKDLFEYYSLNFLQKQNLKNKEVDQALKALKFYQKNYHERSKLMQKIKNMDPLPGTVFTQLNSKKNQAKLRTLNRLLPEYILYYSNTCLDYLQGKKLFKNGNPTPECHKLFKSKEARSVLPPHHSINYDKATFFLKEKERL